MLSDIGAGEILVLVLVALFVFGPERLPSMARQAGKALRDLRGMVSGIRRDLSDELGVDEVDLKLPDVNPRSLVRKHVLEGIDLDLGLDGTSDGTRERRPAKRPARPASAASAQVASDAPADVPAPPARPAYDSDAT